MAQHQKHENQMRDLQLQCEANVRELHQLQVRWRSMKTKLVLDGQAQVSGVEKTIAHQSKLPFTRNNAGI